MLLTVLKEHKCLRCTLKVARTQWESRGLSLLELLIKLKNLMRPDYTNICPFKRFNEVGLYACLITVLNSFVSASSVSA